MVSMGGRTPSMFIYDVHTYPHRHRSSVKLASRHLAEALYS